MLHVRLSLLLLSEPSEMSAGVCGCVCHVFLHFHLDKHLHLDLGGVLSIFGEI